MTDKTPEIASPLRTKAIMNAYGLTFKKSLGQNFLTDVNVLHKIVTAAEISAADDVLEIGPGIGALTEQLAKKAHQVVALELDERLLPVLADTLAPYKNVTVLHQDVLKADLQQLLATNLDGAHQLKVVANLPYYITSPIILHLLNTGIGFEALVVMMQKEVAERLSADPGTKAYGSLSVRVQYQMDVKTAFIVPRTVFVPQPNVDSAIVSLTPLKTKQLLPFNEAAFFKVVKGCFAHRRKSLWNNLKSMFGKEETQKIALTRALAELELSPQLRAEKLTVQQFILLVNKLHELELL
ncbi:16S rRNA (adenine(1518)-N(6)/adenine(1519)-N(6))-dimethyltransferase RsmA [Liquorilactobacillus satsumensis]|uniref:Ribosomal RNA small subunit methyltransferase A n=1 Tax=Liquorilactobacillus satsumensis DSM 16230 = JCM 12392 TaxID=1423801 RepID=A0A0R1V3C4_9LACO|nr:16S rRNA (adenine(1518)-N(6)/adenine(1519)-N(6))-dimethyltransferase RsmA [Liquorilactobacillus satsumensis]KRM00077.1 16S ribosomal RNA methyltransferase KsgA Dim1 family protein [Liquorilactobacillus satsumensis DSM 16230 = JCM 12392]